MFDFFFTADVLVYNKLLSVLVTHTVVCHISTYDHTFIIISLSVENNITLLVILILSKLNYHSVVVR